MIPTCSFLRLLAEKHKVAVITDRGKTKKKNKETINANNRVSWAPRPQTG